MYGICVHRSFDKEVIFVSGSVNEAQAASVGLVGQDCALAEFKSMDNRAIISESSLFEIGLLNATVVERHMRAFCGFSQKCFLLLSVSLLSLPSALLMLP